MRCLAALIIAISACSTPPCEDDVALPGCTDCTSGQLRRGRSIDSFVFVASSPAGAVVRSNCHDNLELLGDDLASTEELKIDYEYHDETEVRSLARHDDGSVAAIARGLEYLGDIDDRTSTTLTHADRTGKGWTTILETNTRALFAAEFLQVAIGPDQLFAVRNRREIWAFARDSGAHAWTATYATSYLADLSYVADPNGGVIVVGTFSGRLAIGDDGFALDSVEQRGFIVAHNASGTVRWARFADELGANRLGGIALAPDGSIAVLGTVTGANRRVVALLARDGSLSWKREFDEHFSVYTLATDGTRIVVAGDFTGTLSLDALSATSPPNDTDGFIAWLGPAGAEALHVATGRGTQRLHVLSLPDADSALVVGDTFEFDSGARELVLGGTTIDGGVIVIAEIVR